MISATILGKIVIYEYFLSQTCPVSLGQQGFDVILAAVNRRIGPVSAADSAPFLVTLFLTG